MFVIFSASSFLIAIFPCPSPSSTFCFVFVATRVPCQPALLWYVFVMMQFVKPLWGLKFVIFHEYSAMCSSNVYSKLCLFFFCALILFLFHFYSSLYFYIEFYFLFVLIPFCVFNVCCALAGALGLDFPEERIGKASDASAEALGIRRLWDLDSGMTSHMAMFGDVPLHSNVNVHLTHTCAHTVRCKCACATSLCITVLAAEEVVFWEVEIAILSQRLQRGTAGQPFPQHYHVLYQTLSEIEAET